MRILILEDSPTDAELIERKLREGGMIFTTRIAASRNGFLDAVTDPEAPPDVILADYVLPSFLGTDALALAKKHRPLTPFIFVTGTMGEETAVEALKSGATDYVLKERLFRLPDVVRRAMKESEERNLLKQAETRRMETEAKLVSANRAKDDFLALLSHELRNPLMPLLIDAELIESEAKEPAVQARASAIHRQAEHMSRLLEDLLDVTRINEGNITLKKQVIDMKEIIKGAIKTVRPLADERGHTITAEAEHFLLHADPIRLEQVIVNLLNNAVKYSDKNGTSVIAAHADNDDAVITVRDFGSGIAPTLLPHVFDMFVRGDQSLARSPSGLGVGLSLVKKIVTLHGGTVEAKSEGAGKGSEFMVRIPLGVPLGARTMDEAGQKEYPGRPVSKVHGAGKSVLVVDDNRNLAETIASVLVASGHTVQRAYDGDEALQMAKKMRPEVVLLDIGLPRLDGLAVARRLREQYGDSMKLVALSGYGQEEDKRKAYEAGFDRYVVKPVGLRELRAIV